MAILGSTKKPKLISLSVQMNYYYLMVELEKYINNIEKGQIVIFPRNIILCNTFHIHI